MHLKIISCLSGTYFNSWRFICEFFQNLDQTLLRDLKKRTFISKILIWVLWEHKSFHSKEVFFIHLFVWFTFPPSCPLRAICMRWFSTAVAFSGFTKARLFTKNIKLYLFSICKLGLGHYMSTVLIKKTKKKKKRSEF